MAGIGQTGGTFVYAQDDPYIHLALARTLAQSGVWGIRPDEFACASSSPLWTCCSPRCKRGCRRRLVALVVNLVAGVGVLLVWRGSSNARDSDGSRSRCSCAVVLVTPAADARVHRPGAHAVRAARAWCSAGASPGTWRMLNRTGCWRRAFSVAHWSRRGTRGCFSSSVRRDLLLSRTVHAGRRTGGGRGVPVVAFAASSVAHGGPVLPNSVLMKSGPSRFATVGAGLRRFSPTGSRSRSCSLARHSSS